jgi:predicted PurR-regulated permease PerM
MQFGPITGSQFRWLSVVLLLLVGVATCMLLISIGSLVKLLVVCALLAYILDPVASYLESLGLSRTRATVIIFLGLAGFLAVVTLLLYPVLAEEVQAVQSGEYKEQTQAKVQVLEKVLRAKFAFLGPEKIDLLRSVQEAQGALQRKFSSTDLVSTVVHVVAVPFVIFFFLKDGREMRKRLISLVPNRYFEFALHLLYRMDQALGNFLRGQFLDGLIFGLLTTFVLWVLNVDYFLFIGFFAGLANLIPYVGPLAGASLAVLVVLVTSTEPMRIVYVLLAFVGIKLLDDTVIQPLTVARSVKMHPLLVLLVIILGGRFFGILGMLLAVPVTGFIKVGWEEGSKLLRKYRHSRLMEPEIGTS